MARRVARAFMLSVALVMAMAGGGAPAIAQPRTSDGAGGPAREQERPPDARQIEGQVQSVTEHRLTLTDGTQLILHSGVAAQQDQLRPGARIKASYAETAGRKVVTSIEIVPGG